MIVKSVWMHPNDLGKTKEELQRAFSRLTKHGFSKVFLFVKNCDGSVVFKTKDPEVHFTMNYWGGDPLRDVVRVAHDFNIEVHPTFVVFCEGNWKGWNMPSEPSFWLSKHINYVQYDKKGEPILRWADPARQEVRNHESSLILEVVENYEIDGVQLDYIRYPEESEGCFCDYCRETVRKLHGFDPKEIAQPDYKLSMWIQWRAQNITSFVEELRLRIKSKNPKIKLSAAVFKDYPRCVTTVAQDWADWIEKGIVDFICPMTYEYDLRVAKYLARSHRAVVGKDATVYEGIGKRSSQSILSPRDVFMQASAFVKEGADGIVIFSYSSLEDEDLIELDKV
ncbi:MAG: glycoside hydrolase family 10 protein [Thermoproteota archaeon]